MQSAQLKTLSPLNKFANLLEKAFQRYECALSVQKLNIVAEELKNTLLIELDALIGEVLGQALQLLDEQIIIVYSAEGQQREIAEIQTSTSNLTPSIYLYPAVNYCQCDHFTHCVLGLPQLQLFPSPAIGCNCGQSYTCAHVVALRLAQLFRLPPPRLQSAVLTQQQFHMLLKQLQFHNDITI